MYSQTQHWFPSADWFTPESEETVALFALPVRRSNHSVRSYPFGFSIRLISSQNQSNRLVRGRNNLFWYFDLNNSRNDRQRHNGIPWGYFLHTLDREPFCADCQILVGKCTLTFLMSLRRASSPWQKLPCTKYKTRICKHFKKPRNRFPTWNRLLGSLNVYKCGLSTINQRFQFSAVGTIGQRL